MAYSLEYIDNNWKTYDHVRTYISTRSMDVRPRENVAGDKMLQLCYSNVVRGDAFGMDPTLCEFQFTSIGK
jgi:hypothetical protein